MKNTLLHHDLPSPLFITIIHHHFSSPCSLIDE